MELCLLGVFGSDGFLFDLIEYKSLFEGCVKVFKEFVDLWC